MHKVLVLKMAWHLHTHETNQKILNYLRGWKIISSYSEVIYWTVKKCTLREHLYEFQYMTISAQKQLP